MDEIVMNKNYKLVPPDGGWAYMICVAAIILMIPSSGFAAAFGMMYNDLMAEIGFSTTSMGLITGFNGMSLAIWGYLTSPLLKIVSQRQLVLIAAVLFNVGAFSIAFANSLATFFLCQSVLYSAGYGIFYNVGFTALKEYFVKKRLFAISLIQTCNAIAGMLVPMVIKVATDFYGHRGMLIIISCFAMQTFVGATLLQPVAWHMKEEVIQEDKNIELNNLMESKDISNDNTTVVKLDHEILSHNESRDNADKTCLSNPNNTSAIRKIFNDIVDVKLFKDFMLSIPCIAIALAIFTDFIHTVMIPLSFYAEGKERQYVAWAVSLIAFGDLATRVIFTFLSTWLMKVGSKRLHLLGTTLAFAARLGMQTSSNPMAILVFLTIVGVGKCFFLILIPVVIADTVPPEKYTGALGISMIVLGIFSLSLGPVFGAIRDSTGSYKVVFWICTGIFFVIILLWVYDLKISKPRKHKIYQTTKVETDNIRN